jgi:hypothetical protein
MAVLAQSTFPGRVRATVGVSVTLAGVTVGMTSLFLGMRAVMEIGGACADGGPFVPVQPCPKGVPLMMIGGIWGGIAFLGAYLWQTHRHQVPSLVALAWPALFLSLGWNFLEYGIDPPADVGLVWGWLFCAVIFVLMGGLPLLAVVRPTIRAFASKGAVPSPRDAIRGQMRPQMPRRGTASVAPPPGGMGAGGSGLYWFGIQALAIAGGIYLGLELFRTITT